MSVGPPGGVTTPVPGDQFLKDKTGNAGLVSIGGRFGARGTHSSRTMMLAELTEVLGAVPEGSSREAFSRAIIQDNLLGKATASTRKLTDQRLSELYALDPTVPLFRVLDRLWRLDASARPQVALLCAVARDPLLRSTAPVIMAMTPGEELSRTRVLEGLRASVDGRLNDAVCQKVARNVESTWKQSGHLTGRVRKVRQRVSPTPVSAAMAIWLASQSGYTDRQRLDSPWSRLLDQEEYQMRKLAAAADQANLIRFQSAGTIIELNPAKLDPLRAAVR